MSSILVSEPVLLHGEVQIKIRIIVQQQALLDLHLFDLTLLNSDESITSVRVRFLYACTTSPLEVLEDDLPLPTHL